MEYTLAGVEPFLVDVIAFGTGSCRPSLVEFVYPLSATHGFVLEVSEEYAEWIVVLNLPVDPPIYEGDTRIGQGLALVPVADHELTDVRMIVEDPIRCFVQIVPCLSIDLPVKSPALGRQAAPLAGTFLLMVPLRLEPVDQPIVLDIQLPQRIEIIFPHGPVGLDTGKGRLAAGIEVDGMGFAGNRNRFGDVFFVDQRGVPFLRVVLIGDDNVFYMVVCARHIGQRDFDPVGETISVGQAQDRFFGARDHLEGYPPLRIFLREEVFVGLEPRGSDFGIPLPALGEKHLPARVVGLHNFLQHLGAGGLELGKLPLQGRQLLFLGIIGYVPACVRIEPLFQKRIPEVLAEAGDLPQLLECDFIRMNLDSSRKIHLVYSLNLSYRPIMLTLGYLIRGFDFFCPKKFKHRISF